MARAALQRETLLAIQDAGNRWLAALGKVRVADVQAFRQRGTFWTIELYLEGSIGESRQQLKYLTERVLDDSLRRSLAEIREKAARRQDRWTSDDITDEDLANSWDELNSEWGLIHGAIGQELRKYL